MCSGARHPNAGSCVRQVHRRARVPAPERTHKCRQGRTAAGRRPTAAAGRTLHSFEPKVLEYLPGGHGRHESWPTSSTNVPRGLQADGTGAAGGVEGQPCERDGHAKGTAAGQQPVTWAARTAAAFAVHPTPPHPTHHHHHPSTAALHCCRLHPHQEDGMYAPAVLTKVPAGAAAHGSPARKQRRAGGTGRSVGGLAGGQAAAAALGTAGRVLLPHALALLLPLPATALVLEQRVIRQASRKAWGGCCAHSSTCMHSPSRLL